ncbi:DUF2130 domain-containing protein ['Camptotheca acuminata' phytoplasma]|uniref:DUF2130 domain-containing protein n=1 Tax='Camptotheca acuminata' phytoplasma TaxID=3239192 RepID=UPI00351A45E9
MKNIKAKINPQNKYELIIQEPADANDTINLQKCEIDWIELIQIDKLQEMKQNWEKEKLQLENLYKDQVNNLKIEIQKQKNIFDTQIRDKEEEIKKLKRERFDNIKLLGEELEKWCNNEVEQHQMFILDYVDWFKDNKEEQGHKGDYIYKVYLNENKLETEILTSAMLEMKTEIKNENRAKKQKNEQHFKKLDTDRKNKNLEFAILVSELEWEQENDLPIKKVKEYDKMYIVRPPYLTTFLSIITALANKYKELIVKNKIEELKFENQKNILNLFEQMKNEILNNSIEKVKKNLSQISEENALIIKAGNNILEYTEKIQKKIKNIQEVHFQTIINKINNFKIQKITEQIQ